MNKNIIFKKIRFFLSFSRNDSKYSPNITCVYSVKTHVHKLKMRIFVSKKSQIFRKIKYFGYLLNIIYIIITYLCNKNNDYFNMLLKHITFIILIVFIDKYFN